MQTFLSQTKWQLYRTIERMGWLGNAALVLAVLAALAYLLALRPLAAQLNAQLSAQQLVAKSSEVLPASNAEKLPQYLASLPPVANRAGAIKALMDMAVAQDLLLDEVRYKTETQPNDAINHYHVEFSLFASYPEIQHFLSELLHQMAFVSLESLTLSREGVQDNVIEARIHLVFHFKQS